VLNSKKNYAPWALHFFSCAKTDLLQCCEAQASRSNAPLY
jgi:hypothetical protein